MFKYCDCKNSIGVVDLKKAGQGRNKMRCTDTDSKGHCVYCGHNAIIQRNPLIIQHSSTSTRYEGSYVKTYVTKYLRN